MWEYWKTCTWYSTLRFDPSCLDCAIESSRASDASSGISPSALIILISNPMILPIVLFDFSPFADILTSSVMSIITAQ